MAKRKKPDMVVPVPDVHAADKVMGEVASIEREMGAIEAQLNKDIDAAKSRARELAQPLQARLEKMEAGLQAFGENNKAKYFGGKKRSLELTHGFLGFRISTRLSTKKGTLDLLKQAGWASCVRVKETIDKEVLAGLADQELAEVKAKRVVEDKFWYETKKEEIPASGERQG